MTGKRKATSSDIYNLDHRIELVHKKMAKEFSKENHSLIKQYDNYMIVQSMAKATREIHVKRMLNLTRMISKNWRDVTKEDVDELVSEIMTKYADERGKETNSSYDHKKVLKMFFRWYKLGTRDGKAGDPPETKDVKIYTRVSSSARFRTSICLSSLNISLDTFKTTHNSITLS